MAPYCLLLHEQPIHHLLLLQWLSWLQLLLQQLLLQRLPQLQLLFTPLHQLGTSVLSTVGVPRRMTGPLQHQDRLQPQDRLLHLLSGLLPLSSRLVLLYS